MELVVANIAKRFGEKEVLRNLSWTFEQGSIYALLGRNGAGKTTLFSVISDLLERDAGAIYLVEDGKKRMLDYRDVFFMVSEPKLPVFLTGREFIRFFLEVNEAYIRDAKSAEAYLTQAGLAEEDWDRLIQGYSTGMKNKLQMLMFLILRPPVILMDEPLTSLDVVAQQEIKKQIRAIQKDHIILFSTHILELARDLCDRIILLHNGALSGVEKGQDADFDLRIVEILSREE